jgi:hypothetical protein
MTRTKDALKGALGILAPLFGGTEREVARKAEEIVDDVKEQVQRKQRRLNAIDTEGEEVPEDP